MSVFVCSSTVVFMKVTLEERLIRCVEDDMEHISIFPSEAVSLAQ